MLQTELYENLISILCGNWNIQLNFVNTWVYISLIQTAAEKNTIFSKYICVL